MREKTGGDWKTRFLAVVKYELLWNIRKKKFIGVITLAFTLATLSLVLPVALSNMSGGELEANPEYVISTGAGIGGLGMFLFAVVMVMNSISGEFESGTIVLLLTKPVSRTTVFLGKLLAAFITLLSAYASLFIYMTVGGWIIYGPQNDLYLLPLSLLGTIISTLVWMAIVLAIGTISKSSLLAALGTFGIFMALTISSPIISFFTNQAWIMHYLPGSGAYGLIQIQTEIQGVPVIKSISALTGTDSIAANLVNYARYPSANVTFYSLSSNPLEPITEPLSFILLRSLAVASAYIIGFLFAAWYFFKRTQVLE